MTELDKWTIKKAKYATEFCKAKDCYCNEAVSYKDKDCMKCFKTEMGSKINNAK